MHYYQKNLVKKQSLIQSKNRLTTKILTISLFTFISCATQEDIKRKQAFEKLQEDMVGQQNITKSLLLKIYNLESSIGNVSGQVETAQHNLEVTEQSRIETLEKRVVSIEEEYKKYVIDTNAEIAKLHTELKEQKKFLSTILKELKNFSKDDAQVQISLFGQSIKNYQKKNYLEAKTQFLEIINDIDSHRLNERDQALVYHNLAMTFFLENDYKNSQIYFSKLFANYESSPLNSSGLYHLGMSFKKQNKNNEASQMFNILVSKYPNSKYTKLAKKEQVKK